MSSTMCTIEKENEKEKEQVCKVSFLILLMCAILF